MLDLLLLHTPLACILLALLLGWLLDLLLGDPAWLPHPVVFFGKMISFGEHRLNKGSHRRLKGGLLAVALITLVFVTTCLVRSILNSQFSILHSPFSILNSPFSILFDALVVFFCLAGTTLIREVRQVFIAVDRSLDEGRRQVARIVGRDTQQLSAQEIRTAALETLAENLSDGVIAPLFWFLLLGTPGMLAYKMVNTLDSMIGYRTERFRQFGCVAARIDDVANYLPARLTALLMISLPLQRRGDNPSIPMKRSGKTTAEKTPPLRRGRGRFSFLLRYGPQHASPNSGWPEAALASILDCRFGGPHHYFGQLFDKPFIGENDRPLTTADMRMAIRVNRLAEVLMVVLVTAVLFALFCCIQN